MNPPRFSSRQYLVILLVALGIYVLAHATGRYELVRAKEGMAFKLDRWTGHVWLLHGVTSRPVRAAEYWERRAAAEASRIRNRFGGRKPIKQ